MHELAGKNCILSTSHLLFVTIEQSHCAGKHYQYFYLSVVTYQSWTACTIIRNSNAKTASISY